MSLIILDRQHVGQIHKITSSGASFDDGHHLFVEGMETAKYIHAIECELRRRGFHVMTISDGTYPERHERVNHYARQYEGHVLYFACHLNAGGAGRYGAMFYDHRSSLGAKLAKSLCVKMSSLGIEMIAPESRPNDWTKNAFYTIKNVAPVAICFEPFFIDNPEHHRFMTDEGRKLLSTCFVDGIQQYFEELK